MNKTVFLVAPVVATLSLIIAGCGKEYFKQEGEGLSTWHSPAFFTVVAVLVLPIAST